MYTEQSEGGRVDGHKQKSSQWHITTKEMKGGSEDPAALRAPAGGAGDQSDRRERLLLTHQCLLRLLGMWNLL